MAINWDEFDSKIDAEIDKAGNKTDETLASKISSLTRMTDTEIQELFPEQSDAKKLVKLMQIVKSNEDRNIKVNKIVSNAEDFSDVMITLIRKSNRK